jgi:uncharacterized protein with beta-barrel porin domain
MSYYVFEGKNDYIAVYPALICTFKASGSVAAGKAVAFDAGNTSMVYQPTLAVASGTSCVGIALNTAADGKPVSTLVWGFAKNLSAVAAYTPQPGDIIQMSGSGNFTSIASGSLLTSPYAAVGKVVSGSGAGNPFMAFISCMK